MRTNKNPTTATAMLAAMERAELYFAAFPGSPSAVRRPTLSFRSGKWAAILGTDPRNCIVGLGATVEAAYRSFDAQYLAALRPPGDPIHRAA
jgi:hypothetical protein